MPFSPITQFRLSRFFYFLWISPTNCSLFTRACYYISYLANLTLPSLLIYTFSLFHLAGLANNQYTLPLASLAALATSPATMSASTFAICSPSSQNYLSNYSLVNRVTASCAPPLRNSMLIIRSSPALVSYSSSPAGLSLFYQSLLCKMIRLIFPRSTSVGSNSNNSIYLGISF